MSTNYVLFCTQIPKLTEDEKEWWRAVAGFNFDAWFDMEEDDPHIAEVTKALEDLGLGPVEIHEIYGDSGCFPGVDITVEDDEQGVYVFSDDGGSADNAAYLLQRFLVKFRPKDAVSIEVAFTCSRSLPGEFGGCAFFITAENIECMGTLDWLMKKAEEHQQKQEANAAKEIPNG